MANVNNRNVILDNNLEPSILRRSCTVLRCSNCNQSPPNKSGAPCPYCGNDAMYIIDRLGNRVPYINEDRCDFLCDLNQ